MMNRRISSTALSSTSTWPSTSKSRRYTASKIKGPYQIGTIFLPQRQASLAQLVNDAVPINTLEKPRAKRAMYLDGRSNDQKRNAIEVMRLHAGERDATVDPLRFTPKSTITVEMIEILSHKLLSDVGKTENVGLDRAAGVDSLAASRPAARNPRDANTRP